MILSKFEDQAQVNLPMLYSSVDNLSNNILFIPDNPAREISQIVTHPVINLIQKAEGNWCNSLVQSVLVYSMNTTLCLVLIAFLRKDYFYFKVLKLLFKSFHNYYW